MQLHGVDVTYGAHEWSKQTSRRTSSARKSELQTSVPRFATPPREAPKRCAPPLRHLPRVTCAERATCSAAYAARSERRSPSAERCARALQADPQRHGSRAPPHTAAPHPLASAARTHVARAQRCSRQTGRETPYSKHSRSEQVGPCRALPLSNRFHKSKLCDSPRADGG
jgi:hypothetical protein